MNQTFQKIVGGVLYWGIPEYRLPNEVLAKEIRAIENAGVTIHTSARIGTRAGSVMTMDELMERNDAVYVAIGTQKSKRMDIPGEDLTGVESGLAFLRRVGLNRDRSVPRRLAVVGGATYSTADTVRPALQLVKTKPGNKIVSSCFILVRPSATGDNDVLAMGDCAINIKPSEDELVEIAMETAKCAQIFGIDPKVAFLSYSTFGSGKGEDVDKMRNACEKAKAAMPEIPVDGELQFDAAVSPRVAHTKCPDSKVAGYANTFIFPDINAGNIGYKIAQRLGSFEAYGPILLGLNAPINDLSRGCNAQEVYSMAIITAALAGN